MVGWEKECLVNLTTKIGSGSTPRGGKNSYKESGISLFRSLNVYDRQFKTKNLAFIDESQADKLSNVIVEEGDVLLNITGASIARCCVAPSVLLPARVNQHVSIIRPQKGIVDSNFLAHLLASKHYKKSLLHSGDKAGATRQALTKAQLQDFEISFPPLPEQKRIVAIVDEAFARIDAAVANTKNNLSNARELFESYLNAVFTQKGDGWVEKTLGEYSASISTGPFGSLLHKSDYVSEGVPLINPINIIGRYIVPNNSKLLDKKTKIKLQNYVLHKGNIVIARRGEIGRCAVIDSEHDGWVCGTGCFFMQPLPSVNSHFLANLIRSQVYREKLERVATGATMKNLSNKTLSNLFVSIPNIEKQTEILANFDALAGETKKLEAIYQLKLKALAELKQSILQKAFAGELTTVPEKEIEEAAS